jgi:predicted aconitase with swiveling domain
MDPMRECFNARATVAGEACGEALVSRMPLSLWGGLDPKSGKVTDVRHDLFGQCVSGKVLFVPEGKGSSSSSSVLLETIRAGTAPAAIVNVVTEPILATGSIIGCVLYGRTVPIFTLDREDYARVNTGDRVTVTMLRSHLAALIVDRLAQ